MVISFSEGFSGLVKPNSKPPSALTRRSVQAERLIAAYVAPDSDRQAIINELITLFDGPAQREAQTLAAEALDEAWREHRS